jgi:cytochrome c oxidase subunit 1
MLFALGFVSMFVIGGLSGIFMASTPVDIYIQDTYFIVAHIHYVVFGGSIMGAFAAIYFWFPKMFGKLTNTPLGHIHFWLTIVFFNATFFPMHIIGVGGQMRRIYNPMQYEFLVHQQHWNVFMTYSAIALGLGQIVFAVNFILSLGGWRAGWVRVFGHAVGALVVGAVVLVCVSGAIGLLWAGVIALVGAVGLFLILLRDKEEFGANAPLNPWNANTLEWSASSPPPHMNWGPRLPTVYRGPYEYSSPESKDDFLPQWQPSTAPVSAGRH